MMNSSPEWNKINVEKRALMTTTIDTTLDVEGNKEIIQGSVSPFTKIFGHVCSIILVIIALFLPGFPTSYRILVIALAGVGEFAEFSSVRHLIKLATNRFEEAYPAGKVEYQYQFMDNAVRVINKNMKGQLDYDYSVFARYYETDRYLVVISRSKQFIAIDKQKAEEKHIKELLQEKAPKIKHK